MSAPEFLAYSPFVEGTPGNELARSMAEEMREQGATFFRFTWFDDEHPSDVYPRGLYVEGWLKQPDDQPPFDFPRNILGGQMANLLA